MVCFGTLAVIAKTALGCLAALRARSFPSYWHSPLSPSTIQTTSSVAVQSVLSSASQFVSSWAQRVTYDGTGAVVWLLLLDDWLWLLLLDEQDEEEDDTLWLLLLDDWLWLLLLDEQDEEEDDTLWLLLLDEQDEEEDDTLWLLLLDEQDEEEDDTLWLLLLDEQDEEEDDTLWLLLLDEQDEEEDDTLWLLLLDEDEEEDEEDDDPRKTIAAANDTLLPMVVWNCWRPEPVATIP
jgi:hypothetical protein